ncbi:MAG: ABC transporter ATP-binding protein [Clostridia bacterium]|nr:ABC transporter ATP-binding protein [Clostridia bacterium]
MSIALKNITKNYGDIKVFDNFNAEFESGKITCILGESGSGKTTLLNIISGICSYCGQVQGGGKVSYIFQNERLLSNLTVQQNLEYVLKGAEKDNSAMQEKITYILKAVELYGKKDAYPKQLSGGMKQRLSMARAFVYPSDTLLMDEPFKSLDFSLKSRIIEKFISLWEKDRRSVVFVTHDIDEALIIADTIYIIKGAPAQIANEFKINSPIGKRDITENYFTEIRNNIYKIMSK